MKTIIIDGIEYNITPKVLFKKGDFVVIQETTYLISKIEGLNVTLSCNGRDYLFDIDVLKNARLWDITKDAKDGDVLYSLDSKQPFIFKHRKPNEQAAVYCGINTYGKFFIENTKDCVITTDKYIPADKSQRDILFKEMQKAGYEWDAEKRELKKIEDEIEIPFGAKDSELQEVTYYIPKGFHAEIDDDKVIIKKGEKPTWSEEDEKMYRMCVDAVEYYHTSEDESAIRDWFKSLKERLK